MFSSLNLIKRMIDKEASCVFDAKNSKLPESYKSFLKLYSVRIMDVNYRFAHLYKMCDLDFINEQKEILKIDAFSFDFLTNYSIQKFIKSNIPFVTKNCMYMPFLSFASLNVGTNEMVKTNKFSPSDQFISIYLLINSIDSFSVSDLSDNLSLSEMTIGRFIKKIESLGLISMTITGDLNRKRIYKINNLSNFYRTISGLFFNPIFKTVRVSKIPASAKVLETSITTDNLINAQGIKTHKIYAAYKGDYKGFGRFVVLEDYLDSGLPEIYLFKYNIAKLVSGSDLDPLSMKLAFANLDDATNEILNDWLKSFPWYAD